MFARFSQSAKQSKKRCSDTIPVKESTETARIAIFVDWPLPALFKPVWSGTGTRQGNTKD